MCLAFFVVLKMESWTDTSVLNVVMSPKNEGGQIFINFMQSYDLHEAQLTQKRICWSECIYREHALSCHHP